MYLKLFSLMSLFVSISATSMAYADESAPVTFSTIRSTILVPKCVRCHQGPQAPDGIDLSIYSSLVSNQVFVAGDPANSDIFVQVSTGQMPFGGPKLSADEIQAIHDWIQQGAQNN